jgi:fatty acid desaturase
MRTMTAAPTTRARRTERAPSEYTQLLRAIQAQGLLERRYGYYVARISLTVLAFAGVWFLFFVVGESWLQLLVAGLFAVVLAHVGFLGHDAAHRQVFKSGRANDLLTSLVAGLLAGMSATWWMHKHNTHHASPNYIGKDPDIAPTVVRVFPAERPPKSRVLAALARNQGWWFFPLLTLQAVGLHAQSILTLLGRRPVQHRGLEITLVTIRLVGYLAVLVIFLPFGIAAAFLGVQLAILGLYLGCSFAPNHKGMPLVPRGVEIDFLRRQVLMSRNVRGNRLMTFAIGGLNYQIEHHLFPSMPRPNLRRAQATVREYCRSRGVTYTETGLFTSYGIVIRYLNRVGLRAEDPFQCPIVATYRPS